MGQFDSTIQRAVEKLYEDERLRSHLTDDEAKIVLGWAEQWLTAQIAAARDAAAAAQIAQTEMTRVRQSVNALNGLAAKPGMLNLADAVAAIQPAVQAQTAATRLQVFKLVTGLLTALWRSS